MGTGDGLYKLSEHLIKMAVFIISTLALHYIKDGERETLKCEASYPTAKIQGITKETFPDWVSLFTFFALTQPTSGRAENTATKSSPNLGRFL